MINLSKNKSLKEGKKEKAKHEKFNLFSTDLASVLKPEDGEQGDRK